MKRNSAIILLAVLPSVALSVPASAQEKTPVRLFAEAEDFTLKSEGWKVVPYRENYFASTFAVSFLSRMACLGAPEQLPRRVPPPHEAARRPGGRQQAGQGEGQGAGGPVQAVRAAEAADHEGGGQADCGVQLCAQALLRAW